MDRDEDFYETAFREVETGELAIATWAKAFALSSDGEHAKKLYIQYRVEQIKNSSQANVSDKEGAVHQNGPDSRTLGNDQLNPIQEEPVENKDPLWLTLVVNIILIVPPARLVGEWSMSSSKNYSFDLLEFLTPQLENGLSWLTLLWPFAFIYWLVKRGKVKGMSDITSARSSGSAKAKMGKLWRNIEAFSDKGSMSQKYWWLYIFVLILLIVPITAILGSVWPNLFTPFDGVSFAIILGTSCSISSIIAGIISGVMGWDKF